MRWWVSKHFCVYSQFDHTSLITVALHLLAKNCHWQLGQLFLVTTIVLIPNWEMMRGVNSIKFLCDKTEHSTVQTSVYYIIKPGGWPRSKSVAKSFPVICESEYHLGYLISVSLSADCCGHSSCYKVPQHGSPLHNWLVHSLWVVAALIMSY